MNDEQPDPRDWQPSDPAWQWGNPGPDDDRRPLFRDRFVDPPNLRPPAPPRPPPIPPEPGPPPEPEPPPSAIWGWFGLLVIVICVSGAIATFVGSWRRPASVVFAVAIGLVIGVIAVGASRPLRNAWPAATAGPARRVVFNTVVGLAGLLGPAGAAAAFLTPSWVPPLTLAGAGVVMAAVFGVATLVADEGVGKAIGSVAIISVVLAACVGGCFGIRAIVLDPLRDKGTTFPREDVRRPTPSWSPPAGAQAKAELGIRHDLESRVLLTAGVDRPVTSDCPEGIRTCRVTYGGVEVWWRITVTGSIPGSVLYKAETDALAITREGVHARLVESYRGYEELRCDDLPDVTLAPVGKPFGKHCYVVPERFDHARKLDIIASELGVSFREVD